MFKYLLLFILISCQNYNIHVKRIGKNFQKDKNVCLMVNNQDTNDLEKQKHYSFLLKQIKEAGYHVENEKECQYFAYINNDIKYTNTVKQNNSSGFAYYNNLGSTQNIYSTSRQTSYNFYDKIIKVDIVDKNNKKVFQASSSFNDVDTDIKYSIYLLMKSIFYVKKKYNDNDFINYIQTKRKGVLKQELDLSFDDDFFIEIEDLVND